MSRPNASAARARDQDPVLGLAAAERRVEQRDRDEARRPAGVDDGRRPGARWYAQSAELERGREAPGEEEQSPPGHAAIQTCAGSP